MYLYSMLDRIAQEFGPTFEAKNDAIAKRSIAKSFQNNQEIKVTDFRLYKLAEVDRDDDFIEITKIEPIVEVSLDVEE